MKDLGTASTPAHLGDGLTLRQATPEDAERLVDFNRYLHVDPGQTGPHEGVAALARDLVDGRHPTVRVSDFTLVEDSGTGKIVSSMNLISQTWTYDGVPFAVGRPELVGTDPQYRRRGLVRAQFDVIHDWSAQRGELVQAITGIPWYYRQFGYEMALELGGGRVGYQAHVPRLEEAQDEPYRIRRATGEDVPVLSSLYEQGNRRYLVNCVRDEAMWRYELTGRSRLNEDRRDIRLVETPAGEPVGFLAAWTEPSRQRMGLSIYEIKPSASWLRVTPPVMRFLWQRGQELADATERDRNGFAFWLGSEHPVYDLFSSCLPLVQNPYAWYIRVPDLPDFVRHISPALERRLQRSILAGYSGELRISLYQQGLCMSFDEGRISSVQPFDPIAGGDSQAAFPNLTFLQLLFGYRALDDLDHTYPDCWVGTDEAKALLKILWPQQASHLWPIV